MIIIENCSNIDKALKEYKKKYEKTKILSQLRERQSYTKSSVKRRKEILLAKHRNEINSTSE